MWPSTWFTPMSGRSSARAKLFAAATPTVSAPISPGPHVTAIASTASSAVPARARASSITGPSRSRCRRDASSGTTPPYRTCRSTWEATTFDRRPPGRSSTAAAVSSHEVSMPRMRTIDGARSRAGLVAALVPLEGGPVPFVALLKRGFVDVAGPHDDRVLAVVAVVALADADVFEPVLAVQRLGAAVGPAHLERDPPRAAPHRFGDQSDEQALPDPPPAALRRHCDRRHVRLVEDDPHPRVADHRVRLAGHEVAREAVVPQLAEVGIARPRRRERRLLDLENAGNVFLAHRPDRNPFVRDDHGHPSLPGGVEVSCHGRTTGRRPYAGSSPAGSSRAPPNSRGRASRPAASALG